MISLEQSERAIRRLSRLTGRPEKHLPKPVQSSLGLTPVDRWANHFLQLHQANPNRKPGDLLASRYPNPRSKSPVNHPFDFEQFEGFGQFLKSLEPADR